jgi:hypothetical protein
MGLDRRMRWGFSHFCVCLGVLQACHQCYFMLGRPDSGRVYILACMAEQEVCLLWTVWWVCRRRGVGTRCVLPRAVLGVTRGGAWQRPAQQRRQRPTSALVCGRGRR